jgi:hypothetical protein
MRILIRHLLFELFYVFTGAVLTFASLEIIWPGIILAYLNINYVLIFWLIIGIIILLL